MRLNIISCLYLECISADNTINLMHGIISTFVSSCKEYDTNSVRNCYIMIYGTKLIHRVLRKCITYTHMSNVSYLHKYANNKNNSRLYYTINDSKRFFYID